MKVTLFQRMDPAMKVSPWLQGPALPSELSVYIHLLAQEDGRRTEGILHGHGFSELTYHDAGGFSYLAGRVSRSECATLLRLASHQEEVQFIEPGQGAFLLNNPSIKTLQSGTYNGSTPFWTQGVYGSNQVLAVLDTGLDADSCFFRDPSGTLPPANGLSGTNVNTTLRKVIACDFLYAGDNPASSGGWDNQGHGTRVAGHALGSKLTDPMGTSAWNGMAPGAQMVVQDGGFTTFDNCSDLVGLGCPVTNFYPALLQAVAQGVKVHNNSWGDRENYSPQNVYTEPCRELDLVTWSNKDFLVVCAAGNSGSGNNTVGSPSVAKNSLSVAATLVGSGQESIVYFSSRGWSNDGRIKPDLCAPGHSVRSSSSDNTINSSNCTSSTGSGTSYSSPMVMGMAALVRDYFAQGFYPQGVAVSSNEMHQVSAALVKAVLINSSVHVLNASSFPPSRDQGWGRVNLSSALPFTNSPYALYVEDHPPRFAATPTLPFRSYLNVQSTNTPLKVTLVWSDYPATAGAGKQLVNDLDLRLVTADDQAYRGNVYGGSGLSVPGGSFDRSNNVEQVYLYPTTTGMVEVSVWADTIPVATQDFALVATGDFEAYPVDRDDDADGLPDYWELMHFGDLNQDADDDPDLDTALNAQEAGANTDPMNIDHHLRIALTPLTNQTVSIQLPYEEARRYHIEYADAFQIPGPTTFFPFTNQQEGVGQFTAGRPGVTGEVTFIDDFVASGTNASPHRLYRIRVEGE